jgi:ATP-dependent helicase HrpB
MLIEAADLGAEHEAAEIAAILVERGIGGQSTDLSSRLAIFRHDRSRRAEDMRRLAAQWARQAAAGATRSADAREDGTATAPSLAALLGLAYPDRIAKARGAPGQFLSASGRAAALDAADPLARSPFLVIAELQGSAAASRILLAGSLDEGELSAVARGRIGDTSELSFDREAAAVRARQIRRLGSIVLASEPRPVQPDETAAQVLADGLAELGIDRLPWTRPQLQLRDRVAFLRRFESETWPDLGDEALGKSARGWLAPFLVGKTRLSEINANDLAAALDTLIAWPRKQQLDKEAPTHFEAPTGHRHPIRYDGAGAPSLHIRVQELFGLTEHPAVAGGRLPLTLHLLSPAHRPIQITRDLPGFWAGSWGAVKAEMKGRYPKHPWPDDPARASPTTRAQPRGS